MSIVGWGCSFEGFFLDQSGLPFGHPFEYLSFLYAFIHFSSKSVVHGGEFCKPKSVYAIKARGFPVCYLFKCSLSPPECMFT